MTPSSSSSTPQSSRTSELIYRYRKAPGKDAGEVLPDHFEKGKIYIAATINEKTNSVTLRRFNGSVEDVGNKIEVKNLNKKTLHKIIEGNFLADATLRARANPEAKMTYKETARLIDQFNQVFNREDEVQRQRKNLQTDRHAALVHPNIPLSGRPSGWLSAFDPESELPLLFPPQESNGERIEEESLEIKTNFKRMQDAGNPSIDIHSESDENLFADRTELTAPFPPQKLSVETVKQATIETLKQDSENALLEANAMLARAKQSGDEETMAKAQELIDTFNSILEQVRRIN